MSDWVPCYASLMQGRKRALPRATRFVFLELCIEAREGGGLVELTPGLDLGDAVHDAIGGNRREVLVAVEHLTTEEMIDCHTQPGFLVITNWERWKLRDITNAERQARFRERKRLAKSNGVITPTAVTPAVTPSVTSNAPRNASNASRSDQKRSEEKRSPPSDLQEGLVSQLTPEERALLETAQAEGRRKLAAAERDAAPPVRKGRDGGLQPVGFSLKKSEAGEKNG